MKIPAATYRIQLSKGFGFSEVAGILKYLSQLGISHIYASPIFQTQIGSPHGYAITDMNQISPELGGIDGFRDLIREASSVGIDWLQDIVPNHMAYTPENLLISDVMTRGAQSQYREYFDVDWNHRVKKLRGKVLAPFLQDRYENCLKNHELELVYHDGFAVRYRGKEFPLRSDTFETLLRSSYDKNLARTGKELSAELQKTKSGDDQTSNSLVNFLDKCNGDVSFLDRMLSSQVYALAYWRDAFDQISYRRFFDILGLICLRQELPEVFGETHKLVTDLVNAGMISGLRVDHVDGLRDPLKYLERLRKKAPDVYVLVEKILMDGEELKNVWPIQGTTGYDFLRATNELFINGDNEEKLTEFYSRLTNIAQTFDECIYDCKKHAVLRQFGGDLENLATLLAETLRKDNLRSRFNRKQAKEAVIELLCSFLVYRTYVTEKKVPKEDRDRLQRALSLAQRGNKRAEPLLRVIESIFRRGNVPSDFVRFVMRLQQFTGAIMAKGVEDTAFYVYSRFISLNEVGSDPGTFGSGADEFHAFIRRRAERWPASMNTLATHDTKRGEDVRARLNVLSEISSEWESAFKEWTGLNNRRRKTANGKLVPSRNEEYYLYQTMVGAFPFEAAEVSSFAKRLGDHMVKAIREAKINSSWLDPNPEYEDAAKGFVTGLFSDNSHIDFTKRFSRFQRKIARYGVVNSLSQTLLKMTCPGVPDFYQGTELWDLNLTDPDNRRSVDFAKRECLLRQVQRLKPGAIRSMATHFEDGMVKLYEIVKGLECRKANVRLFQQGAYVPLLVKGIRRSHVVAFCRVSGGASALVVVPRFLASMNGLENGQDSAVWGDTYVSLPSSAKLEWTNVFSGGKLKSSKIKGDEGFYVENLFEGFPVALLKSGDAQI